MEGGYAKRIAFVSPARMAWQLPIYELALMTAGRAYDSGVELETTIVTPEDSPLAIFGEHASRAVSEALERREITTITSAYAEVPRAGRSSMARATPRRRGSDRRAARALRAADARPPAEPTHGFIRVDRYVQVPDCRPLYAAGDAIDFPSSTGAWPPSRQTPWRRDRRARGGAGPSQSRFTPVILHGMLLTDDRPIYLTAGSPAATDTARK